MLAKVSALVRLILVMEKSGMGNLVVTESFINIF